MVMKITQSCISNCNEFNNASGIHPIEGTNASMTMGTVTFDNAKGWAPQQS